MHLQAYATFALALIVAVATPGPGILAVVSCAMGRGFRAALAMTGGLIIGDLCYFSLAMLGMAALARSMGELFLIVKLIGAGYLIWLGVKFWRARPELVLDAPETRPERGLKANLLGGLTVTLGNPKVIVFYAGLVPTFIDLTKVTAGDAAVMMSIVVAVVGGIPTAYAFAAVRARTLFNNRDRVLVMNRTAGTVMIGAGVAVATQ